MKLRKIALASLLTAGAGIPAITVADSDIAFGSGASATVFGARGAANFLSRGTGILAALFFVNCLLLSSKLILPEVGPPASVVEQIAPQQSETEVVDVETAVEEIITEEAPAQETAEQAPEDIPDLPVVPPAPAEDLP